MGETFKTMLYARLAGATGSSKPIPNPVVYYARHFPGIEGKHGWVKVLCPFHDDHKPSLSINLEHGGFKCFSCGESGDLFTFHMKQTGVNFPQACKDLEAGHGI